MAGMQHSQMAGELPLASDDTSQDWSWTAVRDRWSLGHSLMILAGVSFTLWTGILVLLLS